MMIRPHHFFYFNNTKENKGNMNLKFSVNLLKMNMPVPLTILSLERVESLTARYIIRIQNMAEYDDMYEMNNNVVSLDMSSIMKLLKMTVGSPLITDH